MATPAPEVAGGMATVAAHLREGAQQGTRFTCDIVDSGGGRGVSGYRRFPAVMAMVLHEEFDILHLHVASRGSTVRKAALAEIASIRGLPYVVHLHGGGYKDFLASCRKLSRTGVRRFFSQAAAVVVLGNDWRRLVEEELRVPPRKIHIVPNGVARVASPADYPVRPNILFVGQVTRGKGADLLVDSIEQLFWQSQFSEWGACLVGATPEEDLLKHAQEVARSLGGRLLITGPLVGEDKARAFAEASIFCLPSRAEALPTALLEAMSACLACVCTDVGSVSEVLGDAGKPVPPGNGPALQEALAELMGDAPLRKTSGLLAYDRWRDNYTIEAMTSGMESVWLGVIQGRQ